MEKLLNILNEMHPDVDFESEEALINDGILDSLEKVFNQLFAVVYCVATEECDIRVGAFNLRHNASAVRIIGIGCNYILHIMYIALFIARIVIPVCTEPAVIGHKEG